MRSRHLWMCAAILLPSAAPQDIPGPEVRAREYVQFLVLQLDQWTRDFPQAYNMAMMRPPVDAARLSEAAKAGAGNLRDCVARLASLTANDAFRVELDKTLLAAKPVNEALGAQRFPEAIESDTADPDRSRQPGRHLQVFPTRPGAVRANVRQRRRQSCPRDGAGYGHTNLQSE